MKLARLLALVILLALAQPPPSMAAGRAILFAYYNYPGMDVDTQYRHELQALGYEVGRCNYSSITWSLLRQFNVLVMDYAPPVSYTDQYNTYLSKLSVINQFLASGGGVFVLYENGYDQNYQAPNQFLAPYGASIVNEGVVDPTHGYKQIGYLGWYWARTSNVTAHAVTADVSNVWYPVGYHPTNDRMTATMSLDANWQAIVRGESTAYSVNNETMHSTYASAPPIVAARSTGSGRIVVFPSHGTYTSVDGHHPALQEITWSRGDGVIPSHVYQMFLNVFDWLSAPSFGGGVLGGYVAPADPPPTQFPASAGQKPAVLVISGWSPNQLIDPDYMRRMETEGYRLDSCKFEGLAWDRISKFNVLVIERTPHANNEVDFGYFKAAFPLLKKFLEEGGGILWLHDPSYSQTHLATNAFTKCSHS